MIQSANQPFISHSYILKHLQLYIYWARQVVIVTFRLHHVLLLLVRTSTILYCTINIIHVRRTSHSIYSLLVFRLLFLTCFVQNIAGAVKVLRLDKEEDFGFGKLSLFYGVYVLKYVIIILTYTYCVCVCAVHVCVYVVCCWMLWCCCVIYI